MNQETILLHSATFNPKVKTYIFFIVLFFLFTSVIGWIVIPFWILGLGQWLSGKYFKTLSCTLTNKTLNFSKGLIVHIEKTIPLENIQDLSFIGGPILRYFGLTLIRVETAGGGGGHHNQNMMSMLGVEKADEFKAMILAQREKVVREKYSFNQPVQAVASDVQLLNEIRNELVEIKNVLKNKS
jgi:putative membrane protein